MDIGREIQPTDPLDRVLHQIIAADTRALADTAALLDLQAIERAADAVAASGRVDLYGIGGSGLVGAEMQLCLHRIGLAAWSCTDLHNGLASAALLRPGDVAIGVSHSGQTRETIEVLAEAGSSGATTVALTSFPRSPLAEIADIVLVHAMQATTFRTDALSGRHPQLVVLDLLYVAVAQRTHNRSHAAFQATARAVAGHRREAHLLQQRPKGLRLRSGVLDELDAVHTQGVRWLRDMGRGPATARHATSRRKCASIRAASASIPVKSLKPSTAWPTFMWPPSAVAHPTRRAALSNGVSSGT